MKRFLSVILYALKTAPIITTCLLSDLALNEDLSKYAHRDLTHNENQYLKALCDNLLGHGLTALFTWLFVINYDFSFLNGMCTLLCGLFGSLIDLDHFYAAKSTSLKNALDLPSRPPLHNTSIVFLLLPLHGVLWYHPMLSSKLNDILLALWVAILSHHCRDAHRRGLWFWPIGCTPPLQPNFVYISLIITIAIVIRKIRLYLMSTAIFSKETFVDMEAL